MSEVQPTPEEIAAIEAARSEGGFIPHDEMLDECDAEIELLNASIDWEAVKSKAQKLP